MHVLFVSNHTYFIRKIAHQIERDTLGFDGASSFLITLFQLMIQDG